MQSSAYLKLNAPGFARGRGDRVVLEMTGTLKAIFVFNEVVPDGFLSSLASNPYRNCF